PMNRTLALVLTLLFTISINIPAFAGISNTSPVRMSIQDRGAAGISLGCSFPTMMEMDENPGQTVESLIWLTDELAVPVIRRWVRVPAGHRVQAVIKTQISYLVSDDGSDQVNIRTELNSEQISALKTNPPQTVVIGKPIMFRGVPIAPVSIYPLQLVEDGSEVIENSDLSIDLEFVPDASVATSIGQLSENPSGNAALIIDKLVLNPPRRDQDEHQYNYAERMVIMYSEDLPDSGNNNPVDWLNENFVEWKRKMGYQVDMHEVDKTDRPSDIRQSIIDEFWDVDEGEVPLSYLVIIGTDDGDHHYSFPTEGYHGDNYFAAMDDNDVNSPDICVARIDITGLGGYGELRAVLNRSIRYESDPYMEETDWYSKGLFTAENIDVESGSFAASMVQLGRWIEDRLTRFADPHYTSVDTLYMNQGEDGNVPEQTHAALEEGRSLVLSRGWLWGSVDEDGGNAAECERMNPFICAMTCLSGARTLTYFRTGTTHESNGPIASMGMFGETNTKYNQGLSGWITRSIAYEDFHKPGWIQLYSKLNMLSDYEQDVGGYEVKIPRIMTAYRLLGDPSVNIYTTVPMEVNAEYPDTITTGTTGLNVFLSAPDREIDPDMTVCIYQPGNLQLVTTPGDDGWARFTIPEDALEAGDFFLTITHPNWLPILDTVTVAEDDIMIDIESVEFDDDDGLYASGETIGVTLTFFNSGNEDVSGAIVNLSSEDEWISFPEDRIELGDLAANTDNDVEFTIDIHHANRAGTEVRIDVTVEAENGNWSHAFNFTTSGHLLDVRRLNLGDDDEFDRGQSVELIPLIRNNGDVRLEAFDAELILLDGRGVSIVEGSAHYPSINAGGTVEPDEGSFHVELDSTAIPGSFASFRLDLSNGDGEEAFRDTVYFELEIGEPEVDDPFGPDEYGYLCFDSGDDSWDKCPEYVWIEINPNEDFDHVGTDLNLDDRDMDWDSSAVIELPFDFMFYGEVFNTMIVCSNGWVAFGEENSKYHLFRNWTLPGVGGPDAQIAVLWQDLIITPPRGERGVYAYYLEERAIYIVEWSNMQIYHTDNPDNVPNDHLIECQLILYDPAVHITSTGDGEIKMQYKTFDDIGGIYHDNQFSTIGLKNLDNTDGLQYRYWAEYSDRCLPIENETALLFTVDVSLTYGSVAGRVVDAADINRVMENVRVRSRRFGYLTETDEVGRFEVDRIAAGSDTLYFELPYFNVMPVAVLIEEDSQAFVQVEMTHPEIEVDVSTLTGEAQPEFGCTKPFTINNPGNGTLEFSLSRRYSGGHDTEYENLDNYDISDINFAYGCQFIGDSLYISGTENWRDPGTEFIWVLNRNGEIIRRFAQHNYTQRGFYDLAYDGEHLFGGDFRLADTTRVIVEFDLAGNHIRDIVVQVPRHEEVFIFPKAIAYRPETETFFVAHHNSKIYEIDRNGEIVDQFYISFPDGETPNITGLALFPEDNDGMLLYVMEFLPAHRMNLIKVNPTNRKYRIIGSIDVNNRDSGLGLTIGYDWEAGRTCLASIASSVNNYMFVRTYEIGPDSRFLNILNDAGGYALSNASSSISIHMNADGLRHQQRFDMSLLIEHNADADSVVKPVHFEVDSASGVEAGDVIPLTFSLENAYPNPFNSVTRIAFSLDRTVTAKIAVFDISGRQVALLADDEMPAGKHQVSFDAKDLTSGIYFYRLEAGSRKITKRMVLLK
ncbi:MAG: T9SS type A sorting domain-containing protein, partial [Calditrichaeota bacterium]|nr:T9SS type A sorting domain-containing protein [Calditrichota bacterium]